MSDSDLTRRTALAAALGGAAGLQACAAGAEESDDPCPELVGHKVRLLGPDDAMTMDYDPDRVNIHHDGDFVITRIAWG